METKKVIGVICKFVLGGLISMLCIVLVKNWRDVLAFGIALLISFLWGGILMLLSLIKDLKMLNTSNKALKRKVAKLEKEITAYENENEHLSDSVAPEVLIEVMQKRESA